MWIIKAAAEDCVNNWKSQSTVQVPVEDKLAWQNNFRNFHSASAIQVAKRNSGSTYSNKWKLKSFSVKSRNLTQQCFQQCQFWMFVLPYLMKGIGVKKMFLFVKSCNCEWLSKLGSNKNKKNVPKPVSTSPTHNPFRNFVYFAPTSYGLSDLGT